MISKIKTSKTLDCYECGALVTVSYNTARVLCSQCIIETWEVPVTDKKKKEGYPRGWKFMAEFVHADGTVYFKGIEQPELKGKLEPTVIAVKEKISKTEKKKQEQNLLEEYHALKKKLKSETKKTVKKKIEKRLNQISKLIK